jgi:hypothetical protein
VYVRSLKVPVGERLVEGLYSIKSRYWYERDAFYEVKRKIMYSYVLPDDQNELIGDVERLTERYGLELKIIDVTRGSALDPVILFQKVWRRLKGIRKLPVIETNRGARLRTPFSQSELERFISESAWPTASEARHD